MTTQEHLTKHDREIAAIRKLILTGMKMLNELSVRQRELQASQRETDRQLRQTQRHLDAFILSMRGGANGHSKRKTDLQ